jgi:hypothetical protein
MVGPRPASGTGAGESSARGMSVAEIKRAVEQMEEICEFRDRLSCGPFWQAALADKAKPAAFQLRNFIDGLNEVVGWAEEQGA